MSLIVNMVGYIYAHGIIDKWCIQDRVRRPLCYLLLRMIGIDVFGMLLVHVVIRSFRISWYIYCFFFLEYLDQIM